MLDTIGDIPLFCETMTLYSGTASSVFKKVVFCYYPTSVAYLLVETQRNFDKSKAIDNLFNAANGL